MNVQTRRQKEVLDFITRFIEKNGHKPSYQMIARDLGVTSKAAIAKHVKSLEEQGHLLRRRDGGRFSLEILRPVSGATTFYEVEWLDIPGRDGRLEDWEKVPLIVPSFMFGNHEPDRMFAYRIPDDAMRDKNVFEDDVALIERRAFVRDGECAVLVVEGEYAVFRCYYRRGSQIELRPANDAYAAIEQSADKVEVKGVFRGLMRPAG